MNLTDTITNILKQKKVEHTKEEFYRLAKTGKYKMDKEENYEPSRITQRDVARPFNRISPRELKYAAYTDPICFNTLNKTTQLILSAGYRLEGDSKQIEVVDRFTNSLALKGTSTDWETVQELTFKNQLIFGRAFIEKIYNKQHTRIVDLDLVDPEVIDYARDYMGNIVLDENGDPKGYVEYIPYGVTMPKVIIPFPNDIKPVSNGIYVPADRMIHFSLYPMGDGINDYGIIEPVYPSIQQKKNVQDSFSSFLVRLGYPILAMYVGDDQHEPSENQLKNALEEGRKIKNRDVLALPYWAKATIIEPQAPEGMREQLNYFNDEIIAGLGMPKAFSTGGGEETNRATLARQEYLAKIGLKNIMRRTYYVWNTQLFKPLCEQEEIKGYPRAVPNEIALEELDSRADRIDKYARAGILTPDKELEEYIRRAEAMPKMGHSIAQKIQKPDVEKKIKEE